MTLSFQNPWWLLAALLAIPVIITGLLWFTATMSRARAVSAVVLRSILIALLAAMLAGASAVRTADRLAVIAVVDISDSVRQFGSLKTGPDASIGALDAARQWLGAVARDPQRRPEDLLGVVVFDGASLATAMPRPKPTGAPSAADRPEIDFRLIEGTDIDQALRYASALFPPDARRRLVLISDGSQTQGDALAAARELGSPGAAAIPIDVVPIAYRVTREVMVEAVDAPPQASSEATIDVRVVLNSTDRASGRIELIYEGQPVDLNGSLPGTGLHVDLPPGRTIRRLPVKLSSATVHRFQPIFIPDDPAMDRVSINNSADAFTITPGKGSVLVVDGVDDARPRSPGRTLVNTLTAAGINVETIAPADVPTDLLSLQAYDLIILENVAAEELPRTTHALLADYVTDLGGGLVMVGGPDSFGAGGWNGTDLEPILPVELDLPEQLLVPSAAIVFVLDNSGSMAWTVLGGMRTKQEIANEGAALAIEMLDATDLTAVIAFNSMWDIVVPMQRNTNAADNANRVRAIAPGGGTEMYSALAEAFSQLQRGDAARANVRHVILLTDGQSQGDPQSGIDIAHRMRAQGITVSTIAVGDEADLDTLSRIAEAGGGAFYPVVDPNTLPRIFLRDVRIVRKPLIRETPFRPVNLNSGSPITLGMPARLPTLTGLVLTQPLNDPLINNALVTPEGEPLLAHWFVGRGQVAAFTSDAHHWASQWLSWEGYSDMWTRIARTIGRPATQHTSELTTEIIGDELLIRLDASDEQGAPLDLLTVPGTAFTPDKRRIDLTLEQVGPGAYQTRIPATMRGNYVVALFPRQGDAALPSVVGAASRALGAEFHRLRSNVALLKQIADVSGGRVDDLAAPLDAHLFDRQGVQPVRAASPLWPVLLVWSLIVLLLDVGTRRVAWDRLLTREIAAQLREQAAAAVHARSQRAAHTVAALRKSADRPRPPRDAAAPKAPLVNRGAPPVIRSSPQPDAAKRRALRGRMLDRLSKRGSPSQDKHPPHPPQPAPGQPVHRDTPPVRHHNDPETRPPDQGQVGEHSTTSGLLEAKRRARKRLNHPAPPDEDSAKKSR